MPLYPRGESLQANRWWNSEIVELRSTCNRARRQFQRSRGRSDHEEWDQDYRTLRGRIKEAIRRSKRDCFKRLCVDASIKPWGMAYPLVMKKLQEQRSPQVTYPRLLQKNCNHAISSPHGEQVSNGGPIRGGCNTLRYRGSSTFLRKDRRWQSSGFG